MTENNYLIRDYEEKTNGRVLCKQHGLLRCSECEYLYELERVNKQLKSNLSVYKGYYKNMIKINEDIVEENKRYRKVIESMKSEISYALHSHKSKDVKRHYLENAVRYADEALEESE